MAFLIVLVAAMRGVGGHRLLYSRLNWDNLFESANPPGAPNPSVARGSYTRDALRTYHTRRAAYRSGISGLSRAIRSA